MIVKYYRKVILLATIMVSFALINMSYCDAAPKRIGKTDMGILYILTEAVKEDKIDKEHVIFAISEEKYTNPYFLARIHQHPKFKDVEYCWKVYMFDVKNNTYSLKSIMYINAQKVPVLEKEVNEPFKPLSEDKEARQVYKAARDLIGN